MMKTLNHYYYSKKYQSSLSKELLRVLESGGSGSLRESHYQTFIYHCTQLVRWHCFTFFIFFQFARLPASEFPLPWSCWDLGILIISCISSALVLEFTRLTGFRSSFELYLILMIHIFLIFIWFEFFFLSELDWTLQRI